MVAVFGSSLSQPNDPAYTEGVRCGRLLAKAGFHVATGGYAGTMEAVSKGAADAGATVFAVTAPELFPGRVGANEWAHVEWPQPTLPLRIGQLIDESVAAVALPGSIGTLTELMVAWNASFIDTLRARPPRPVVAVGDLWSDLVAHITAAINGSPDLVTCVTTVEEAVAAVVAGT